MCHGFKSTSKMTTFGSILTTFESSNIFGCSWGSIENWLEPKTEPPSGYLACTKSVKHFVPIFCLCYLKLAFLDSNFF